MSRVQIVALILSLLVTGFIIEKARRRSLAVEYSLIWIVAGLGMIAMSLWKQGIEYLANLMGIFYAPSALFVVFGGLMIILGIHFSLTISKLSTGNRLLVQRVALQEDELKTEADNAKTANAADIASIAGAAIVANITDAENTDTTENTDNTDNTGNTDTTGNTDNTDNMQKETPKILAIIPAWNEEKNVGLVVQDLKSTAPWLDVLVIDDGSTDQTAEAARSQGAKVISLPLNLGIGGAMQTGFMYAVRNDYDVALQVDGDGQHRAEEIGKLIEPVIAGEADVTIGSRFLEKTAYRMSRPRRVGIYFLSKIIRSVAGKTCTDPTSGFRAYNRKALRVVSAHYSFDYPEPDAIVTLVKNQMRVSEVSVEMDARISGKSSITPLKSFYYMFKVSLTIILNAMMDRLWPE